MWEGMRGTFFGTAAVLMVVMALVGRPFAPRPVGVLRARYMIPLGAVEAAEVGRRLKEEAEPGRNAREWGMCVWPWL